jgi:peptidoglycan/LPS O-acetylase OafA/YrhL
MKILPNVHDIRAPIITFFISVIILIPISLLSFQLLEKPYMSQRKH